MGDPDKKGFWTGMRFENERKEMLWGWDRTEY